MPEYLAPGVYVEETSLSSDNMSFDTLNLPVAQVADLKKLCQYIEKGYALTTAANNHTISITKGIAVLFAGSPGTGKTLAAEILASKVGMPLFKIDLSQIVNKYIGETEKNLGKIFEQAEEAGM